MDGAGVVTGFLPYDKPYPIAYEGMNVETLSVTFDAPDSIGIYKIVFESTEAKRLGEDELFVQGTG